MGSACSCATISTYPLDDGKIADYTRIDAAIPTLRALVERGARVIVLSHLGRPEALRGPSGAPQGDMLKYSLRPVATALAQRLGGPVAFAAECIGTIAREAVDKMSDGDVVLLENVRFTQVKSRTIRASLPSWPRWATSTSTMLSVRRIARMPQPKRSRTFFQARRDS